MSDYSRQNDFSAKDALPSGNPAKKIVGAEVDAELDAIVTAVASKSDSVSGAIQNNVCTFDASGNPQDSGKGIAEVLGYDFVSTGIALASGDNKTSAAHGLSAVPTKIAAYLKCTTPDLNYSIGDIVALAGHQFTTQEQTNYGYTVSANSTNVYFAYNANGIRINDDSTPFTPTPIDTADWELILCAS